ncbi:hypothetical protein SAMN05216593_10119 [Pseudomonas asturiensis]|uniref:Prophage PssSM-03 n=1 Tax=Pseudomonas asturiensis TaxID=1190415 RepID=A0A1M7IZ80_9PSED|nr:hypothetical protein [Pseudomonas asturiensis]SHM46080.1 hypothetical protein SAMN05216593_10119 [Pseudomonas asturiensis]
MKKSHGPSFRRELKFIVECNICMGKGVYTGLFHQLECVSCHGSGWVCGHTLQPVPLNDIVPVLNQRLKEALAEIASANRQRGGAHQQYEQNNRRGAGGSNYTGD